MMYCIEYPYYNSSQVRFPLTQSKFPEVVSSKGPEKKLYMPDVVSLSPFVVCFLSLSSLFVAKAKREEKRRLFVRLG